MKHTTPTPPPGLRMVDRVCAACGAPFQRPAVLLALIGGRYCDGACEVAHCAPEDRSPITRLIDDVIEAGRETVKAAAKAAGNVQQRHYANLVRGHTAESWRQHQARQAAAAPVRPLTPRTNAEDALMDAIKYGAGLYVEKSPDDWMRANAPHGIIKGLGLGTHLSESTPDGASGPGLFGDALEHYRELASKSPGELASMMGTWGMDPGDESRPAMLTMSPPCAHYAKPSADHVRRPVDRTPLVSRMTMRQHFAGQAMQGYIASMHRCPECGPSEPVEFAGAIARDSVRMADALVEALQPKREPEQERQGPPLKRRPGNGWSMT